jgi:branched-chain amino acid transport system permease protein
MRSGRRILVAWALPVIVVVALGLTLPVYWVYIMSAGLISALIARSVGFVTIQAGLISLCQMSFAAIGGWVVSWLALNLPGVPFPLLVIAGGLVVVPAGWVLGLVTTRIRGVELAVVTLGLAAGLDLVLRQGSFPGVATGTPVSPAPPFDDPRWFFLFAVTLVLLLQAGVMVLTRSRVTFGWATMKVSEKSAAAMGLKVHVLKASAFAIGALFSGLAGGLLAAQYGLLTTAVFSPMASVSYLATAVLCGASFFGGAVLAGLVTVLVPELLGRLGLPLDVATGLLALGAFDVLRRGNGGLIEQLNNRVIDRRLRDAQRSCSPASAAATSHAAAPTHLPESLNDVILETRNLAVSFGQHRVLDSIDLAVHSGEVHALIGPNGAGKTILIDAVTGFLSGYEGTVLLEGDAIDGLRAHQRALRGVRRTFQQSKSVEALTVDEFLSVCAGSSHRDRVDKIRDFFGLPDGAIPIRLLDAGSRRVLDVAGAVASGPRVVLLDEPASGLPEQESRSLAQRVREIPATFGCAVLLVEHDIEFVTHAASRVTAMQEGRVIQSGTVKDVLAHPAVISSFLGRNAAS